MCMLHSDTQQEFTNRRGIAEAAIIEDLALAGLNPHPLLVAMRFWGLRRADLNMSQKLLDAFMGVSRPSTAATTPAAGRRFITRVNSQEDGSDIAALIPRAETVGLEKAAAVMNALLRQFGAKSPRQILDRIGPNTQLAMSFSAIHEVPVYRPHAEHLQKCVPPLMRLRLMANEAGIRFSSDSQIQWYFAYADWLKSQEYSPLACVMFTQIAARAKPPKAVREEDFLLPPTSREQNATPYMLERFFLDKRRSPRLSIHLRRCARGEDLPSSQRMQLIQAIWGPTGENPKAKRFIRLVADHQNIPDALVKWYRALETSDTAHITRFQTLVGLAKATQQTADLAAPSMHSITLEDLAREKNASLHIDAALKPSLELLSMLGGASAQDIILAWDKIEAEERLLPGKNAKRLLPAAPMTPPGQECRTAFEPLIDALLAHRPTDPYVPAVLKSLAHNDVQIFAEHIPDERQAEIPWFVAAFGFFEKPAEAFHRFCSQLATREPKSGKNKFQALRKQSAKKLLSADQVRVFFL